MVFEGDHAQLGKWWPQLTRATAWLESVRAEDDKGLIGFEKSGSCGHYGYSDCGHETYGGRSAAVKKAVNEQLWDEDAGAYRLSREIPGAYPQDGNVAAVLTGIADGDRAGRTLAYLHQNNGTPNLKQFSSLAHGWAAQPTVTLSTRVLGVRPAAPGYASWAVVPFTGNLKWAEGTVPTPHGDIAASWRKTRHGFRLEVAAPRGTHGRLAVPVSPSTRRVTLDGRTVWANGQARARAVSSDGRYVYVDGASAGRHTLTAS